MAEQISLFDGTQPFKIDKPIRLIELFAGIGAQAKALENLGVDFEHYRICEFDKYAVKSYNAIHGTNFETSDITKITADDLSVVDTDKYCYVMTYSFPCQDLSPAGNGKGMSKGSGTRSGLLWEVERLLTETKNLPQVLLMENVPQVIGQKNMPDFAKWIAFLDGLGYKSKYALLNAKDYGIPQNRERCFMVSIFGDYFYEFPAKMPLKLRLKDMLEERVDERYYLSEEAVNGVLNSVVENEPKLIQVAQLTDKKYNEMTGRVYSGDGLWDTIRTMQGGCLEPKIVDAMYNNREPRVYSTFAPHRRSERQGLDVIEPLALDEQNRCIRKDGTCGCIVTDGSSPKHNNRVIEPIIDCVPYRIRKLIPKETWRLMGFTDADVDKAVAVGISNAQLYKQAGNSIVVQVLEAIFKQML